MQVFAYQLVLHIAVPTTPTTNSSDTGIYQHHDCLLQQILLSRACLQVVAYLLVLHIAVMVSFTSTHSACEQTMEALDDAHQAFLKHAGSPLATQGLADSPLVV